jgi:PhnB protein
LTIDLKGDDMGTDFQGVIPMIAYEDGVAAIEWLNKAFGFLEIREARYISDDGTLGHAEMETGSGIIMLATPTPDYESPRHHRETCDRARQWLSVPWVIDGVLVYVNDLESHFDRARLAGAVILTPIEVDLPGKRYRAEDLEGHRWFFFEK